MKLEPERSTAEEECVAAKPKIATVEKVPNNQMNLNDSFNLSKKGNV